MAGVLGELPRCVGMGEVDLAAPVLNLGETEESSVGHFLVAEITLHNEG